MSLECRRRWKRKASHNWGEVMLKVDINFDERGGWILIGMLAVITLMIVWLVM